MVKQKIFQNIFFTCLIRSSTKIIELDNVKFPKSISSNNGVSGEFLEIGSNSKLQKKLVLQKREFSYSLFQSISYNNLVVTTQIYFSPTFRKSSIHNSDNTAGVVGGAQYY